MATIFVAKIPLKATAREIWNFFKTCGEVLDIILPKRGDKYNNKIDFFKTKKGDVALKIIDGLRRKEFLGSKLDLKMVEDRLKKLEFGGQPNFGKKKDVKSRNIPKATNQNVGRKEDT